ncbi:MAG TPA: hypothetical protein VIK80_07960 [Flavihumibacter sp.]|jgi:hypothetical protein
MEKKTNSSLRHLLPLTLFFVLTSAIFFGMEASLRSMGMDVTVLMVSNLILFLIFLLSLWLHLRSMETASTAAFMRNVYSGMLLKLFGGAIAAFIYIYLFRDKVNKPALFGSMALYVLYTIIELRTVLRKTKTS